jgi:hypothetical protein
LGAGTILDNGATIPVEKKPTRLKRSAFKELQKPQGGRRRRKRRF